MYLTPHEQDKLLIFVASELARKRQARGLKLNYPEAVAILSAEILEAARDGKSVSDIMVYGTSLLKREDVMDGIPEMLHEVQVEATFPDGTKLVTVHDPIQQEQSFLQRTKKINWEVHVKPGEYLLNNAAGDIEANGNRSTVTSLVKHTGDRPIQIGSHYHFLEVNGALDFDRQKAHGMHLNIPAGTAVRFEPGDEKEVSLVAFGGTRMVYGHRGLVNGTL